jgi:simple sugar transport system permease protein
MSSLTLAPVSGLTRARRGIVDVFTSPKSGPVLVTAVLFVLMFTVGGLRYRGFFSGQVFLNLLIDNSYLIVLAIGMSFVIITGGIDLSVGAVVALSTIIAARLLQAGWSPAIVIVLILVATSTLGLLVGLMIHVFKVQPFIATLAAMFLARGLCYIIAKESISITHPFFVEMANLRIPLGGGLSVSPSVVIALLALAAGVWVLQYTRFGRTAYAIGGGEQSGMLMGLPTSRTKVLV